MISKKRWIIVSISIVIIFCFIIINIIDAPYRKSEQLIKAIELNDVEQISDFLNEGVDPNCPSMRSNWLYTMLEMSPERPLSVACEKGDLEIVELLINYGATAELSESAGWSPLRSTLFYCKPDDVAIIKLLLQHGATVNDEESGYLPVFYASMMIPKRYDEEKSNGTVFFDGYDQETAKDITEIVSMLLPKGSPDIKTDGGTTLLMNACKVGNFHLVEYLISIGCDTNIADSNGKTAYDYALENGYTEIANLLKADI